MDSEKPSLMENPYHVFLESRSAAHWKRIGVYRRAGVVTPLFSIYSESSCGIGELPDLKLLIDWCVQTGMSLIQLLPLNDAGFKFTPYDAESAIALDPMYLSLEHLQGVKTSGLKAQIKQLRKKFVPKYGRVQYGIKRAKLELLEKIFKALPKHLSPEFQVFCDSQSYWLEDYAFYKVLKRKNQETGWESWAEPERNRDSGALKELQKIYGNEILFYKWLQWQLFEQFRGVKTYAATNKILLIGDLPFLVARDSADVWAHQNYFKLDLAAGAPPDLFFANGQRWGMPPYQWDAIAAQGYDYLIQKLHYAENFYDFFRIDHFVGLFRIWTIPVSEPLENAGLHGRFDPDNEWGWEEHGKRILEVMLKNTTMFPCAEDLGVVPPCSYRVLAAYAIPGMDIQRWTRDWDHSFDFKDPKNYRMNSMAVISTHDMTPFKGWWLYEADTVDEVFLKRLCDSYGISFDAVKEKIFNVKRSPEGRLRWKEEIKDISMLLGLLQRPEHEVKLLVELYRGTFHERQRFLNFLDSKHAHENPDKIAGNPKKFATLIRQAIAKAHESASVFSVQLLQDWLSCDPDFKGDDPDDRINKPGSISEKNWSMVLPCSLDELLRHPINTQISKINQSSNRS